MEETIVRNFENRDIEEIVKVFEDRFSEIVGYIPRTPELWRYLVLDHPGVSMEGIFVAEVNGEVIGYIVIGLKGMAGARVATIYEFCAKDKATAMGLLERAVQYANEHSVDYVLTQLPPTDDIVSGCLQGLRFTKMFRPATKVMITLIDPLKILTTLVEIFNERPKDESLKKFLEKPRRILVKIDDTYATLCIEKGKIVVKPEKERVDVTLEMTPINFMQIFFGLISPLKAYFTRKVRIRGIFSNLYVFEFIGLLQLKYAFFLPLTEHF